MAKQEINLDANQVIEDYRRQVDDLNFQNTVLRLQLAKLQEKTEAPAPAVTETIEPNKEA